MLSLSVVIPVYREAQNIQPFLARLEPVLEAVNSNYEILFCLDPSPDETEAVIRQEIVRNPRIKLIVFSRRFGQPAAVMAGLFLCKNDACVVIDVDLQDPPELIKPMYDKLQEGYEVVYAKRKSRKGETLTKRFIAHWGYKLMNRWSDLAIPKDTGDFRIMTRRVIEELRKLNETHGFLRGLVAYIGFKQTYIEYDRDQRLHGKGHYNRFTGSLKIGLNGIINFSTRPLQLISLLGVILMVASFFLGLMTLFTGIQLLALGLVGEYIGRIYDEVKRRPMYIVDRIVSQDTP